MDTLLFHPKLVHVPMALAVLMPLVAGGLLIAWWQDWLPTRAWLVAVGLQAVLVGSGLLALGSGQAQEDRVERVVAERLIEQHEEAAELFVWTSGGVLALMVLAAALGRRRSGLPLAAVAAVSTLAVLVLGYRTGQAGGSLVYDHGAAQVYAVGTGSATAPAKTSPGPGHKDDDE